MYGPPPVMSPAPPSGRGGRVTVWRVVAWVLLGGCLIGGVGLFACVPLTVLAVRNRSRRDALLAVGALVYAVLVGVAAHLWPNNPPQPLGGILALGILAQGIAATAYYITCDRRRLAAGRSRDFAVGGPFPPYQPYQPYQPYGMRPPVADAVPSAGPVPPEDAVPFAPPLPSQPDRLGQVRAELDELSDYLRKEQGR